jgi:hypothetical protein
MTHTHSNPHCLEFPLSYTALQDVYNSGLAGKARAIEGRAEAITQTSKESHSPRIGESGGCSSDPKVFYPLYTPEGSAFWTIHGCSRTL